MKLIRKTSRKIGEFENYGGVCHKCNSPIEYKDKMIAVVIEDLENEMLLVPIDTFICPHCDSVVTGVRIYKSMNISKELETIKHG